MDFSASDMIERIKSITPLKNLESVGISVGTISAWKTNNRPPRSDDLYTIAKYLNVSMEWLLTGIEPEKIDYQLKYNQLVNAIKELPI